MKHVMVVWLSVVVGVVAGCGGEAPPARAEGEPLRVVATIYPLASLAEQVVGEAGEVEVLVPPGTTEHSAELSPTKMRAVAEADVLVAAGLGVDPVADVARRANPGLAVIGFAEAVGVEDEPAAADAAHAPHDDHGAHAHEDHAHEDYAHEEHEHDHETHEHGAHAHDHHGHAHAANAHLWLDPAFTVAFVGALAERLGELEPEHGAVFEANAARVAEEIREIEAAYAPRLGAAARKELVTFHNAFDPLAEHFGLRVVQHLTDVELNPGGEVTPGRLAEAIEAIREHDLTVIYAEPQFPRVATEALAAETGVRVLTLDPLGNPDVEGYETYQAMLRSNLETLVEGQGGE